MLIKIVKNAKDVISEKHHVPQYSRRDFLAQTAKLDNAYFILPAFYALLKSDAALASAFDSAFRTVVPSYTHLECAGGNGMTRMICPLSSSGTAMTSGLSTLGIHSSHSFNSSLIQGLTLNQSDAFYTTLMSGGAWNQSGIGSENAFVTASQVQTLFSKATGTPIACQSIDDTAENSNNPLQVVAMMRQGQLANMLGTNLISRNPDGTKGLSIIRASTVQGLVNTATLQADLNRGQTSGVLQTPVVGGHMQTALTGLVAAQASSHSGKVGGQHILDNIAPGMGDIKARFDPSVGNNLYNINLSTHSSVLGNWINYANISEKEKYFLACIDANIRQVAGGVYIGENGFDYHDNPIPLGQSRHAFIARFVLLWAAAHAARGKPGMLSISTDGGIAFTNEASPNPIGDNGPTGTTLMFYYDPAARRPFQQVGYFSGESASRTPLVGQDPSFASYSIALTYGLMSGLIVRGTSSVTEFINEMNRNSIRISGGESQLMQLAATG